MMSEYALLNEDNIARPSMKELRFGSQRDFLIIYLMIGLCGWKTIYGDRHDCEQPRWRTIDFNSSSKPANDFLKPLQFSPHMKIKRWNSKVESTFKKLCHEWQSQSAYLTTRAKHDDNVTRNPTLHVYYRHFFVIVFSFAFWWSKDKHECDSKKSFPDDESP